MDPTKISGPVGEVIQAFERLLKVQRDVQSGINEMGSGIRASRNAASSLASQMERGANAAKAWAASMRTIGQSGAAPSGGSGGGFQGPGINYGRGPAPGTALVPAGSAGGLTPPGGGGNLPAFQYPGQPYYPWDFPNPRVLRSPSDTDRLMAGVGLEQGGRAALGAAGSIFDAGADADSLLAKMKASRFTDANLSDSKTLARDLVGKVPGLTVSEALELILQTASFTGDAGEALALSPTLARNAQVLSQYGHKDAITQIEQAVKAGELTGLTLPGGKINLPKLTEFVNRLTAVDVSSGGTMDLGKYLTSIRQYGVGADAASMDFVTAVLPAYQKIMGEAKAGTALASLMQSFSQTAPNTQNKSFVKEQMRLGLRGKDGTVTQGDLLRSDTNAWITDILLPALVRDKKLTPQDQSAELYKILPRQTMVRLAASGIFDAGVIEKEAARNRAQIAAGDAPLDNLLRSSPLNQVKAFSAALNLVETTLADPAMGNATGSLRALTNALIGFSAWSAKNPTLSNAAVTGGAAIGGASYVAGSALILGYFAKKAYEVGKWGLDFFKKDVILPGESTFNAIDGSSIAGRAARSVLPGAAKMAEPVALAMFGKSLFEDTYQQFHHALYDKSGLVAAIEQLNENLFGSGKKKIWEDPGPDLYRPINMTGVIKMDGKTVGSFGARGVQSGTSQPDGKMSLLPAGLPSGGGN